MPNPSDLAVIASEDRARCLQFFRVEKAVFLIDDALSVETERSCVRHDCLRQSRRSLSEEVLPFPEGLALLLRPVIETPVERAKRLPKVDIDDRFRDRIPSGGVLVSGVAENRVRQSHVRE